MKKPTITSYDVAREARVSQSAVSRAFSPGASISDATRQAVIDAAERLGYRPNALARAVISGRSRLIALVVAYLDNHLYPVALEKLARALQGHGYQVLLFMTEPGDQDKVVERLLQFQVEGIVMASATMSSGLADRCAETGTPVVLFNRTVPAARVSSISSDNVSGGRMVGEALAAAGYRSIAFIAGQEDSSTSRDREAGFVAGLAAHGRKVAARAVGGYSIAGAVAATRQLFSVKTPPGAVFVTNDHMAFAAIDVLRTEFGLRVPEDVAVVGYDDVPEAGWASYSLTTVAQPLDDMVAVTVDLLLQQIGRDEVEPSRIVLPVRLIVRASARVGDAAAGA